MADITIKTEVEDGFEEDEDLHIPNEEDGTAWLVKVPDYIWKAWNDLYQNSADEAGVEIGKMRVYKQKPGEEGQSLKQKVQIRLTPGVSFHHGLPLVYDLKIKTDGYDNTLVFSEKDLPGHNTGPGSRIRRKENTNANTGLKPTGIPQKADRYGKPGTYRTSIPKQTALAPIIQHVADAQPVEDETYYRHFEKQYRQALQPKATTAFQRGIDRNLAPGGHTNKAFDSFNTFALSSKPGKGNKKVAPKEKAVRVSREELLDRLYQCFRKYRYWSLRALRNELRQPEAFIKETLEDIATLVRSGDFAMNYKLKDEYARAAEVKVDEVKEDMAAIKSEDEGSGLDAGGESLDEEDDGDDFEDVKMEG